ncbi:MAG: ParA family protein [Hyphomicrobium sp.]|jgi:chromosome partitioning protein
MTVIVAFVSRKGGVGKSTLARALATVTARYGLTTALADLDQQQRTSIRWQHLREKEGVYPSLTVRSYGNVDSAIASESDADVLIIDAPSQSPMATTEIASVAHLVVQPAGSSFEDLQPAVELFYELGESGMPKSRLYIALSRMLDPDEEQAARAYVEVADFNLLPGAVVERARYREAHNRGRAFIECPGEDLNGTAGIALGALLTKIVHKHRLLHEQRAVTLTAAAIPQLPAPPQPRTGQRGLSSYSKAAG